MHVSLLPQRGGVVLDAHDLGRALRVSGQRGEVVLSLWRGDACIATHHLTPADVAELVGLLAAALAEPAERTS
jgi:hypothetical protein